MSVRLFVFSIVFVALAVTRTDGLKIETLAKFDDDKLWRAQCGDPTAQNSPIRQIFDSEQAWQEAIAIDKSSLVNLLMSNSTPLDAERRAAYGDRAVYDAMNFPDLLDMLCMPPQKILEMAGLENAVETSLIQKMEKSAESISDIMRVTTLCPNQASEGARTFVNVIKPYIEELISHNGDYKATLLLVLLNSIVDQTRTTLIIPNSETLGEDCSEECRYGCVYRPTKIKAITDGALTKNHAEFELEWESMTKAKGSQVMRILTTQDHASLNRAVDMLKALLQKGKADICSTSSRYAIVMRTSVLGLCRNKMIPIDGMRNSESGKAARESVIDPFPSSLVNLGSRGFNIQEPDRNRLLAVKVFISPFNEVASTMHMQNVYCVAQYGSSRKQYTSWQIQDVWNLVNKRKRPFMDVLLTKSNARALVWNYIAINADKSQIPFHPPDLRRNIAEAPTQVSHTVMKHIAWGILRGLPQIVRVMIEPSVQANAEKLEEVRKYLQWSFARAANLARRILTSHRRIIAHHENRVTESVKLQLRKALDREITAHKALQSSVLAQIQSYIFAKPKDLKVTQDDWDGLLLRDKPKYTKDISESLRKLEEIHRTIVSNVESPEDLAKVEERWAQRQEAEKEFNQAQANLQEAYSAYVKVSAPFTNARKFSPWAFARTELRVPEIMIMSQPSQLELPDHWKSTPTDILPFYTVIMELRETDTSQATKIIDAARTLDNVVRVFYDNSAFDAKDEAVTASILNAQEPGYGFAVAETDAGDKSNWKPLPDTCHAHLLYSWPLDFSKLLKNPSEEFSSTYFSGPVWRHADTWAKLIATKILVPEFTRIGNFIRDKQPISVNFDIGSGDSARSFEQATVIDAESCVLLSLHDFAAPSWKHLEWEEAVKMSHERVTPH